MGIVGAMVLVLFLFLPSIQGKIYSSPDETSTAVVTEQIMHQGHAFLTEPLVRTIPWLHPRSWVSQGERVVPVGFLAWPWFLHWPASLFGTQSLAILASVFIWSGMIPWYLLLRRRFPWGWAATGTALVFFFPTFLLYGNRSLFGNQIQLAIAFWAFWLMDVSPSFASRLATRAIRFLMGALIMLALMIRPVEAIWLLPWMIWWWNKRCRELSGSGWVVLGALSILAPLLWLSAQTYGSWSLIGYFLRDNASSLFTNVTDTTGQSSATTSRFQGVFQFLPFGFHPVFIGWNVVNFLVIFLWPWAISTLVIFLLGIYRRVITRHFWKRISFTPTILSLWMIIFLLAVYGSGRYTDHIRPGAVTIGNSFIRYLLPLVPWFVIGALLFTRLLVKTSRDRMLAIILTIVLCISGVYWSFLKDDEGILVTRSELIRYTQMRSEFDALLPKNAIVISERSDKIFFPLRRAVSPLPSIGFIQRALTVTTDPIYLYARPMSGLQRDAWRAEGIEVIEIKNFGRERLYRISLFQR